MVEFQLDGEEVRARVKDTMLAQLYDSILKSVKDEWADEYPASKFAGEIVAHIYNEYWRIGCVEKIPGATA